MLIEQDGFKVKQWEGHKWLIVESAKLAKCLEFINGGRFSEFDGIIVSKDLGFTLHKLDFVKHTPSLYSVSIADHFDDFSPLYSLKGLRTLHLAENKTIIDLAMFHVLEDCSFDWNSNVQGLASCRNLRRLIIGGFSPREKRMESLPPLPFLTELSIVKSNIVELMGMCRFPSLTNLELSYMARLEDINGVLDCPLLESAIFAKCRQICNHEVVQGLKNLRILKFNDCGSIKSISFIESMKNLDTFAFSETNVVDGDLRHCLRLRHVGFSDQKHFSHTFAEIRSRQAPVLT